MTVLKKNRGIDALDTRELILETALRLFAEQGFEAVSTRLIAKESGANISLISYYFGSKEKLFEAILSAKIPQMRVQLEAILHDNTLDSWAKVFTLLDLYIDRVFHQRSFNRIIIREMSLMQRPDHANIIVQQIMANWQVIFAIFEQGQTQNVFRRNLDITMTWVSILGTVFQIVNNSPMACAMVGAKNEEELFSDIYIDRVRQHLRGLLVSHLTV
jgi:AcrR family transcriptional regulator